MTEARERKSGLEIDEYLNVPGRRIVLVGARSKVC